MKTKYLFRSMLAMAGVFAATSCSQEELYAETEGDFVEASFTIETPDAILSRAIGDGTTVDQVTCAVFDANGEEMTQLRKDIAIVGKAAQYNVRLAKGQAYRVAFFAYDKDAHAYDVTDMKNIVVTYGESNLENRDAFTAKFDVTPTTAAINEDVTLYRPFAQLNLGAYKDDVTAAAAAGIEVTNTQVTVSNVYTAFNAYEDKVAGETSTVTFGLNAIPTQELEVDIDRNNNITDDEKFAYLALNYILVGDKGSEKSLSDVTFKWTTANGKTNDPVSTFNNIPVQRNYRTNIVGSLLTNPAEFNIEIDANFTNSPKEDYILKIEGVDFQEGSQGEYSATVYSAEGLQALAEGINAGTMTVEGQEINTDGITEIILDNDIDLSTLVISRAAASNWAPIGTEDKPFTGVFDGNGHTLKNLNIIEEEAKEGKAFIGFFGYAKNATIKNVVFENVNLSISCLDIDHSQGHIGAVAGSLEGTSTIENVTVKGDIKVYATQEANGASRVAVVAGGNSYGDVTMKNVHVIANEGSSLIANNNAGALAGQLQGKSVFENCSSNIDVTVNKFFAGGIIGLAAGDQLFTNCHTTGNIAVVAGRNGKAHDQYRVGGIAGGWADNTKTPCTLTNCSYSGNISGKNSDGSVTVKFDYLGYVGRGYTLNGCAGSKVIIDGVSFVQVGNTAADAGKYDVTGEDGEETDAIGSKEDLPKTEDGSKIDTVFDGNTDLLDDIELSAGETNANSGYGATGAEVKAGGVLDGHGNTLTVNGANSTWDCVIAAIGGTIKNLTVKGAMRGIFMPKAEGDLYIDNVIFDDVIYTFNSDGGNKNYGVYISNSTLNGWTSHSDVHKEVVYTNCSFGEGNGYSFCRPYGPTSYIGCDFAAGHELDARGKVTFENCTIGGVALTAENLATLVTSNIANATVK